MSTIASSACWPSRFWLRFLAVFLTALVLGMLVAVAQRRPATEVKAHVVVLNAAGAPIAARVYRNARSRAEMREDDYFTVKGDTSKSLAGGPRDFMVWALDEHGKTAGEPEHQRVEWPRREGQTVTIRLQGAPAAPSNASEAADHAARTIIPTDRRTAPHEHASAHTETASGRPYWVDHALRPQDTQGKSKADIQAMVNELYAAAGYRFHKQSENELFEKKGYKLTTPDMTQAESAMSPVQRDNLQQLQQLRGAAQ